MTDRSNCFYCRSNLEDFKPGCRHGFCRGCFNVYIKTVKLYPIRCPICFNLLHDAEYEPHLDEDTMDLLNEVKLHRTCLRDQNKIQCYNPDCSGIFDSKGTEVDSFICAECGQKTCLKCWATHAPEETCEQWAANNPDIMANRQFMAKENKLQQRCRHGMACPECGIFVEKLKGCDSFLCPSCRIAICFKTKQRRWGPKGLGDTSSGCKCLSDGKTLCHPRCKGCTIPI